MKKLLIIIGSLALVITIALVFTAIFLSFKVVRKSTDEINQNIKSKMQQIVRIPNVIPPETKTFYTTAYVWEMETNQGEITKVKFTHDTLFDKNSKDFVATLEMENDQDPSLFNKVLPAVIADLQAIISAQEITHTNLGKNETIGYDKITINDVQGRLGQVSNISWYFPKERIVSQNSDSYQKLHTFPTNSLKALYFLQRFIITIFSS